MSVHEFKALRERRAHRSEVARSLAATAWAHPVPWAQLGELPEWCLWPDEQRARLVRVAGALFAAPGMRLWIDAARLRAARSLVGERLFDRVMQSPALPAQAPGVPDRGDLARLLDTAGRSVLLGSLTPAWMRSFAAPRLPPADAQSALCPAAVAQPLAARALQLLQDDQARAAQRIVLREPPNGGA
ncbi:MAG: hypothetical protein AB1430_07590 [Pseudomonadota bacterium]